MSQHKLTIRRLLAGAAFICLGACGGGGGPDPAPVVAAADSAAAHAGGAAPAESAPAAPATAAAALPSVCGFSVKTYATVAEPMKLSFGRHGVLYAGRQGGTRIHRIGAGGAPVEEFGPSQADPDAVLVDTHGRISGVPQAVLVGGDGILAAIFKDQSSRVIFSAGFDDVDDMQFDRTGRLVFSDDLPQVLVSSGGAPTVLFATPSRPGSIAIDDDNRIFVALADGTIRIHNADGSLADAAFASGLAGFDTYLAFGPGAGGFGKQLYVLNGADLLRFDRHGRSTKIGSGFAVGPASGTGFVFGPDHALYVSEYARNRIVRVAGGHAGCPHH